MALTINIPQEAEKAFRDVWGADLERAALEALVIEGYRSGRFGISRVRRILGFETRYEAECWLGQHGVFWNYGVEDLEADLSSLAKDYPQAGHAGCR